MDDAWLLAMPDEEIKGAKLICAWLVSACVLLSGAAALGYFGSAK